MPRSPRAGAATAAVTLLMAFPAAAWTMTADEQREALRRAGFDDVEKLASEGSLALHLAQRT